MRTTTRRMQSPSARRQSTQRIPSSGRPRTQTVTRSTVRTTNRTTKRAPPRGLSPRSPSRRSPLLGILSLVAFALFWLFLLLAFNSLMVGAQNADGKRVIASGVLGLVSFLWPIAGFVLGLVGVVMQRSQKVVAGIGLGLNVLLLGWILIGIARH